MKKTLLAIDQGEHLGGAERFLSDLLTRITDEFDVIVLTGSNENYHQRYAGSNIKIREISIPKIRPSLTSLREFSKNKRNIKKIIQEVQPDIVLSNTVRTHMLVSSLKKAFKMPLLWMMHDLTFPKFLLQRMVKYPDAIICCSEEVKASLPTQAREKASILYPFGIEKVEERMMSKKKIVGMVGKFIPWKGQDIFIDVVNSIQDSYPDWSFEIIGSAYKGKRESEGYLEACRQKISEHSKSRLTIRSSENAQDEIRDWSILIHCSTQPEPLGRVVLEGMQAGCAVIASRLGGPKEIIQDGVTGLLIEPNQEEILQTLRKIMNDQPLRERLADAGKQYVHSHYLWETQIDTLKKTLQNL